MAGVWRVLLVLLVNVVVVLCANDTTTAAPTTTPASATTTPAPKSPGILETIETFISAIPVGIATACETGAEAVKNFFINPFW